MDATTRFPKRGEGWRHHNGTLYEIIGTGHSTVTREAVVVCAPYKWALTQPPNLDVFPLQTFLGTTSSGHLAFRFERD